MDEIEVLLARRLSRGKGKFKSKLPLIYFKYNKVGHFATKCPNRGKDDINDKKDYKYGKNKDYKEKGKKSCYIYKEEHTKSSSNDDKYLIWFMLQSIKI